MYLTHLDFRHTLTVKPANLERKRLQSYSSPETPPESPGITRLRAYVGTFSGHTY
jgi:hypothetical protein